MLFNAPRAWDNLPLKLSIEEISNPFEVIEEFFQHAGFDGAIEILSNWMYAVFKNKRCNEGPTGLLFFCERLECLIEAAHLINQMDNRERGAILHSKEGEPEIDLMNPNLYCGWLLHNSPWDYFPRNLTVKEFMNPYIVFRKFFKHHALGRWRDILHDLLPMGLSKESLLDDCCDIDMLTVTKYLHKLIEAAHLIEVREFSTHFSSQQIDDSGNIPITP